MTLSTEGKSYEDRIRRLGLWTLKERRNRQDLIDLCKMFKGLSRVTVDGWKQETRKALGATV